MGFMYEYEKALKFAGIENAGARGGGPVADGKGVDMRLR